MYFGESVVDEYITEGWFKNIIDKIFKKKSINEKNKNSDPQKKTKLSSNKEDEDIASTIKFKSATSSDLKKIYNTDGIAIEGVNFLTIKGNKEMIEKMVKKFEDAKCYLLPDCTIYVASGDVINKTYDLEGDNAYQNTIHITLISFDDISFAEDINYTEFKQSTQARWWRDIVDNNEYREYKKGRHKASQQIQWLIDAYNRH